MATTIRITDTASALAYLDSIDETYERSKDPDCLVERGACSRCGGSGQYSFNMMDGSRCYGCNGTGGYYVRRVNTVAYARKAKTAANRRRKADEKRARRAAAHAAAAEKAATLGANALEVLRGHFDDDSTHIADWNAFCEAVDAYCGEHGAPDATFEVNAKARELRRLEVEAAKAKAKAEANARSTYVGTIGQRSEFTLRLTHEIESGNAYGAVYLYFFLDDDGNAYKWASSRPKGLEKGETYTGKATVKAHNKYEGLKQTVLTRATFAGAALAS